MNDIKPIVAKNIASLRLSKKMTQIELAEKLNYSDKAVSKWERGESLPDISVLVMIADLFEVPLDYLVRAEHKQPKPQKNEPSNQYNRSMITLASVLLVWFIALFAFIIMSLVSNETPFEWLAFVYAIPVSSIVWLVFNSIWFNQRRNYFIISVLVWSLIASIHISLLTAKINIWMLYLLGIPAQLIIIAWSLMKKPQKKPQKKSTEANEQK